MAKFNRTNSLVFSNIKSSTLTTKTILNTTSLIDDLSINHSESLYLVEKLTTHITLILTIIGLIGNASTVIVLNRQSMRKWRSSMLLSALAASDFLYLGIIFLSIIDTSTGHIIGLHRSLILCQTTVYITHVCSFLSASFTLSFTLQRFVAVLFPLHANTIISNRSSLINILVLSFVSCGYYTFSFFVTKIVNGQCREDEKHPALFPLLLVDTCLTFILPFICILLFNCAIVYKLRNRKRFDNIFESSLTTSERIRNRRSSTTNARITGNDIYHERQHLYDSNLTNNYIPLKNGTKSPPDAITPTIESSNPAGNGHSTRFFYPRLSNVTISNELTPVCSSNSYQNRQGISQRTTKMLVICSTTFLLFNSPYNAVLLYSLISKKPSDQALGILRHFYCMSFCFNFFLYSLCGHRFRHELFLLFKICARKCCTKKIRSHCLRIEKIPQQTSFTRINNRNARV